MESSEPAFFPEWLRSPGSVSGGGNSSHHFVSSSHSDFHSSSHSTGNRSSRTITDKDTSRSSFLDRPSSSSSQRSSSSNGSSKHPYSSFSRSHGDKKRDKEKKRSVVAELWDHECSDPLGDILIGRAEKETLRLSRSLVCRKPGEVLPRKIVDVKNGGSNNHNRSKGVLSGGSPVGSIHKTAFGKDFPHLGVGVKQGVPDIGRVLSPVLSTAVQSLPVGNPGLIGGEGWTSVLAEVPTIIGSNGMLPPSVQQSVLATKSSGTSSTLAGLNIAEALSQTPSRARTPPQLPDMAQRLEDLAIKKSRQLIPMTPSMPKGLVLSSDKSKAKTAVRTSEMNGAAKCVLQQPHSAPLGNQSLPAGQGRSDASQPSHAGKFLILKSLRENGVSSVANDVSNPINNSSRVANSQLPTAPVALSTPLKSPNTSKISTIEHKVAALALNSGITLEKRPSLAQAKSRSDFFNLMRKKTSSNTSATLSDSGVAALYPPGEKSGAAVKGDKAPVSPCVTEGGIEGEVSSNGDTHEGGKNLFLNGSVYPDEEEAAFLRSLGWEENTEEDDGLTEEEINAFYEEYMKLKPSLKLCRGMEPKLSMLCESHLGGSSSSSDLSSSGCEAEE
ncbi:Endochitinase [Actinidia chinensis var. chinensis]|uniref:Endochitinase n=1 Tax=Actinidia chinensis var. chinensis TaxID=1590841 RepID=A0A2R6RP53_ACTCC|nr:Endochitinase [Actinidia chinensis var. chinensis]